MEENVYTDSVLTFVFTNDGRIIVKKDKEGMIDTLPWMFMGYRATNSKMDYEDSIWVINNRDEYNEKIAEFFVYHLKGSRDSLLEGFIKGNANYLLDVGELHDRIAPYQIEEMKNGNTPSFIRVHNGSYDGGINKDGQQIINRIEIRYIVLPNSYEIEQFPELEALEFDRVSQDYKSLSHKMILGVTGTDGNLMKSFIDSLTSSNRGVKP